jgi:putative protease
MRSAQGRSPLQTARPGDEVVVGFDREAPRGAKVYRVGSSGKRSYSDVAKLPLYRPPRRFDLEIGVDREGIRIEIVGRQWRREEAFPAAEKHALDPDRVAEEFRRTRIDGFKVGECRVAVEGDPFLPASRLKALRREFWEWFAEQDIPEEQQAPPAWEEFLKRERKGAPKDLRITRLLHPAKSYPTDSRTVAAYPLTLDKKERINPAGEYILPHFCAEGELPRIKKRIERLIERGVKRLRITSLYQLELVKELNLSRAELELTAAYPLPVANSLASEALGEAGVTRVQGWLELERRALEALRDAGPLPVEIYNYGRPVLLVTRAKIPIEGQISDSRGGRFIVSSRDEFGLTHLYPGKPMAVPALPDTAGCIDLLNAEPGEEETESFNFNRELV